jgi:hypothetical protein
MPNEDLIAEIKQAVEEMDNEPEVNKEFTAQEANKVNAEETIGTTEETIDTTEKTIGDTEEIEETEEFTTGGEDTEEEVEEESASSVISDEVLTRAVQIGIPLADARQFGNEAQLRTVVDAMERQIDATIATRSMDDVGKTDEVEDPFTNLPKLDPDVHDPEVVEMYDKLVGIVKGQREELQAFRDYQDRLAETQQGVQVRELEQWFDKQVSELGDDFSESLGVGGYSSLPQGSPQLVRRNAIAERMTTLLAGYNATGQQAPPDTEVFDMAARLVLRDEYQKIHEKKLSGKLSSRASQHIQRASGSKAKGIRSVEDETAELLKSKFNL